MNYVVIVKKRWNISILKELFSLLFFPLNPLILLLSKSIWFCITFLLHFRFFRKLFFYFLYFYFIIFEESFLFFIDLYVFYLIIVLEIFFLKNTSFLKIIFLFLTFFIFYIIVNKKIGGFTSDFFYLLINLL